MNMVYEAAANHLVKPGGWPFPMTTQSARHFNLESPESKHIKALPKENKDLLFLTLDDYAHYRLLMTEWSNLSVEVRIVSCDLHKY